MAIKFEYYKAPDTSGEESDRYYARAVTTRTITTDQMAGYIQEASSLTIGDIKSVLVALSDEIAFHLGESERVHLEGIGYFQATLKCDKEIDPEKTRARSVWFKSVKFRADQQLKNKLKYVQTVRSTVKRHSAPLTNEEVDQRVADFFQKEKILTRRQLEGLCHLTQSTASRQIKRLKEEGKIKNIGLRTQPIYVATNKLKSEDAAS
ncbi:MAG: HU family DNA-binding protein [Bacteroides sp.]|nr:HU family DNA-binding protein [Bacteroides sp.]